MKTTGITMLVVLFISSHLFAQVAEKAEDVSPLLIGERIPGATLKAADGKSVTTSSLWKGNTILIIYRGGWCPFCNTHLNEVGQIQQDLVKMGYQIVAVSPDAPQQLDKLARKQSLHYRLLGDEGATLIKSMGLAFKTPERSHERLNEFSEGTNKEFLLPVPSLFIVNDMGEILFEYINPNYKVRISKDLLMAVASTLASKK